MTTNLAAEDSVKRIGVSKACHLYTSSMKSVLASLSVIVALATSVSARSVAPKATAGNWKTYKHPVGISVRYPGDWTLQEVPGFIQLNSPEVQENARGQPTELYFVSAEQ